MIDFLFNGNTLWILIAVIAAVFILVALIKYKHARPVLITLFCVAWLILGMYSGVKMFNYYNTHNQTIGSPEIHDPYENFNYYEYNLNNIVWHENTDGVYKYEIEYATNLDFEGEEKKYQLLVNDTPCTKTISTNGRLHGDFEKQFKDIDGNVITNINFTIDFQFYSSEIYLQVTTDATAETIGLVREYVNVNGFNLRIIETIYSSTV